MARLDLAQIEMIRGARVAAVNFTASGASTVVTTAITNVLSTAGQGGVAVPLQPSVSEGLGVITTGALNRVVIVDHATQRPLADGSNNEVYGRLTETAGAYTLTYFTLVSGTETAYTFGSATPIDFYFSYRFDAHRLPRDSELTLNARLVQQDPSAVGGGGTTLVAPATLTVTALNTLSALPQAPSSTGRIILYVNGKAETVAGGAFTVSGTTVTWSSGGAGYNLLTTMEVIALIW